MPSLPAPPSVLEPRAPRKHIASRPICPGASRVVLTAVFSNLLPPNPEPGPCATPGMDGGRRLNCNTESSVCAVRDGTSCLYNFRGQWLLSRFRAETFENKIITNAIANHSTCPHHLGTILSKHLEIGCPDVLTNLCAPLAI